MKRYQVFISSTFLDLKDARQEVSQALLRADCFPAGMELFPAADEEQFDFIKKVIEESDYYIVISAGKYGSLHPETGLSYTEMEYDYAQSLGKPIVRLLHKEPFTELTGRNIEKSAKQRKALEAFRKKLSQGSLVRFWSDAQELGKEVVLNLNHLIRSRPATGWTRREEKHAETSLADNVHLSQLPDPFIILEHDGSIKFASKVACDLLGIRGSPLGKNISELVSISDGSIVEKMEQWKSNDSDKSLSARCTRVTDDIFLEISGTPIFVSGENYLYLSLRDVTELKTLEAQFVQSQKMQAVGQLAGGIAHDFNNLLTVVLGNCDKASKALLRDESVSAEIESIQVAGNRAASLVSQLLAFSRKQTLQTSEINIREVIGDLRHILDRLLGENYRLRWLFEDELPLVRGDSRSIEQVVMNLVVNARDAMPDGGTVRIEIRTEVFKREQSFLNQSIPPDEYVIILVNDEGHGIDELDVTNVFEPFFTTKKVGEGTGLGLSTAFGIVKQHDGFLLLESEIGVGTTFKILLPALDKKAPELVYREAQKKKPDVVEAEQRPIAGTIALVVEDETQVRELVVSGLKEEGLVVFEAESAEDALRKLDSFEQKIDLLVTDVVMPGQDGVELSKAVVAKVPDVSVVYMSGYAEGAVFEIRTTIERSAFLAKPFLVGKLVETIASLRS